VNIGFISFLQVNIINLNLRRCGIVAEFKNTNVYIVVVVVFVIIISSSNSSIIITTTTTTIIIIIIIDV